MRTEEAAERIADKIQHLQKEKQRVFVAIDGRCAAGKTTLAHMLQSHFACDVIPMDSFFLRPEQRTAERYRMPGGNVDYERLQTEVWEPLKKGISFSYRPFSCALQTLGEPVAVQGEKIIIFEGSYSCHPLLWDQYDLHIFLSVDANEQLVRLEKRDAKKLQAFQEKWIPLEEAYFSAYDIEKRCELSFQIGEVRKQSEAVAWQKSEVLQEDKTYCDKCGERIGKA